MARSMYSSLLASLLVLSLSLNSAWCLEKSFGFEGNMETADTIHTHHTVQFTSLLPATICTSSTTLAGNEERKGTLKVVDKHGPCSQLHPKDKATASAAQILALDQARVHSIQSRLSKAPLRTEATTIAAQSGLALGSGNYYVTVGLGTPRNELSLEFDTGSDLTWTQCEPCAQYCYPQKDPIFGPSKSSSYVNISCGSADCQGVASATGQPTSCTSNKCEYAVEYYDQSYTIGDYSKETITLESDVFDDFLFGCGQNNQGLLHGTAGLLGLGRSKVSIVEQTAQKYNRVFSYCLPSTSSLTGYLNFGNDNNNFSGNIQYTPLVEFSRSSSFYALDLQAISVAGRQLSVSPSVFSSSGTIIDSGTVISRLPPTVYEALKSAFEEQMTGYTPAPANSLLDTCYDLRGEETGKIPEVSFVFGGGVEVKLEPVNILYHVSDSQDCLAFAANTDVGGVTIFGSVQQKKYEVVYDLGGARIGFAPAGCS